MVSNTPHAPRLLDAFEAQWAQHESDEACVVEAVVEVPVQEDARQTLTEAHVEEAPFAHPAVPRSDIFQQALLAEKIMEEIMEEPPTLNDNAILEEAFLNDVSFLENIDLSFLDD